MSFSFTIPYITFLGLTLLIIIGITIFLIRRMNNQNQKFSSIVGVVTSLAEELNSIKTCISNSINSISNVSTKTVNTNLIHVSDDEDDSDEEDETDDDSEDEEDVEDVEDVEAEEADEDEEAEEAEEDNDDISVVNVDVGDKFIISLEEDINSNIKYIHLENNSKEESELSKEESEPTKELVQEEIIIATDINSFEEDNIQHSETDTVIIKKETNDYKKMTMTKLKSLVSEKGLSDNISKLKKNELIQLLESNSA
jgi:hypothetical protein